MNQNEIEERLESAEKWMKQTRKSHNRIAVEMEFQAEYDLHFKKFDPPKGELRDRCNEFMCFIYGSSSFEMNDKCFAKFQSLFPDIDGTAKLDEFSDDVIAYFESQDYPRSVKHVEGLLTKHKAGNS